MAIPEATCVMDPLSRHQRQSQDASVVLRQCCSLRISLLPWIGCLWSDGCLASSPACRSSPPSLSSQTPLITSRNFLPSFERPPKGERRRRTLSCTDRARPVFALMRQARLCFRVVGNYAMWQFIQTFVGYLGQPFIDAENKLHKVKYGSDLVRWHSTALQWCMKDRPGPNCNRFRPPTVKVMLILAFRLDCYRQWWCSKGDCLSTAEVEKMLNSFEALELAEALFRTQKQGLKGLWSDYTGFSLQHARRLNTEQVRVACKQLLQKPLTSL